jgi:hypothetical protein
VADYKRSEVLKLIPVILFIIQNRKRHKVTFNTSFEYQRRIRDKDPCLAISLIVICQQNLKFSEANILALPDFSDKGLVEIWESLRPDLTGLTISKNPGQYYHASDTYSGLARGGNEVERSINPKTGEEIKFKDIKSNLKKSNDLKSPAYKMRLQASRDRIEAERSLSLKKNLESIDRSPNINETIDKDNIEMDISDPI